MFREELEQLKGIDYNKDTVYTFDVDTTESENFGSTVLELKNIAEGYGCECYSADGLKFNISCKGADIEGAHDRVLKELREAKVSSIHEGQFLAEEFNIKAYRVTDKSGKKYGFVEAYDEKEAVDIACDILREDVKPLDVVVTEMFETINEDDELVKDEMPEVGTEDDVDLSDIMSEDTFSDVVYFDNSKLFVGFNEKETGFWIGQDKDGTLVKVEGPFASREGAVDYYNQHPELESQSKEESLNEAVDYTEKTSDELKKLEEETNKKLDELITRLDTYVKQHRVEVDCNGDKLLVTTIKKSELGAPLLQGMWRKNEIAKDLKDCRSITIDKRGVDQISKNEFESLKQQVIDESNRLTRVNDALRAKSATSRKDAIKHEYVEPTKDEIKFLVDNITRIYVSVSGEHYERDIYNLQKRIPQFDSDMIDKYVKVKKGQWALAIKAHLKTTDGLPISIEDSVEPEKKMMNNTYKLAAVIASNWDTLKDRISKEEE